MPLYEFKCESCGIFEQWLKLSEDSTKAKCPLCQELSKRIFSAPAVLSGSLRLKQSNPEPKLVKQSMETKQPRVKNHTGGRPWMIGH